MPIVRRLQPAYYRQVHGQASHHVVAQMDVYAFPSARMNPARLAVVGRACDLIRRRDPRRWARMQADISYIVFFAMGELPGSTEKASGAYLPGNRGVHVSSLMLDDPTGMQVALTLVHEATHARLYRAGIRPPPMSGARDRIERRCVLEEMSFAVHLLHPTTARQYIADFAAMRGLTGDPAVTALLAGLPSGSPTPLST